MTKNSFFSFLFVISFLPICSKAKITKSKSYTILAKINEIAITKHDLDSYIKINSKNYNNKSKESNYKKALDDFIDLNKKYIIAKRNGIVIDKKEETNLWIALSVKIGTNKDAKTFCIDNNIGIAFLNSVMEKYYIWEKYIEVYIKRNINLNKESILEYVECSDKNSIKIKYNISEIVIKYNNLDKKKKVEDTLYDVYNKITNKKISFENAIKSVSNLTNVKNNGNVGWIFDSDFSPLFLDNIKNLQKGELSKPFCVGENTGSCFIILINDKEKYIDVSEQEKIKITKELYNEILNNKIKSNLNKYNDEIKVTYYNH